jgi:hypothetical protein
LIKKIREVRRLYWNVIKKSNATNQAIIHSTKTQSKKGRSSLALGVPP